MLASNHTSVESAWPDISSELLGSFIESQAPSLTDPAPQLDPANRGSWFSVCVTKQNALTLHQYLTENDITTVYDLGAGDLRLSMFLANLEYDVVAFETNTALINYVSNHYDVSSIDIRSDDYYEFFDTHTHSPDACYACFGGTNKLPFVPTSGVAVEGYDHTGIHAWHNATPIDLF